VPDGQLVAQGCRAAGAAIPALIPGDSDYGLSHGIPLDDVPYLAGNSSLRTNELSNQRQEKVSWNIAERKSI